VILRCFSNRCGAGFFLAAVETIKASRTLAPVLSRTAWCARGREFGSRRDDQSPFRPNADFRFDLGRLRQERQTRSSPAQFQASLADATRDVEGQAQLCIEVILDSKLNSGGPMGLGSLGVNISARRIQLFAPSNGYFPDGAVRHEVLHVQRFHVEGVPKLALADGGYWDKD
jgi:hypothetical protein